MQRFSLLLLADGIPQGMENFLMQEAARATGQPVGIPTINRDDLASQGERRLNKASKQVAVLTSTHGTQSQSLDMQSMAQALQVHGQGRKNALL